MVSTIKFSEFKAANLNDSTNKSAGLSGGANATTEIVVRWTTAGRPSAPFNGILGYNTDLSQYEYWDSISMQWFQLGTGDTGTVTLVNTGTGLTGGPITDTGTISFAAIAANSLWANIAAGVAVPTVIPTATWLFTANNLSDVPNKATARVNLGLEIGVNVEAWSATLDTIAALGKVPLDLGGTNANLTANVGGIFYSTATAGAILAGTATAGQILRSGASAAPSWSTATYPATAGTSGNILTSDGTNWLSASAAGVGSPLTTKGDLYTFTTVNARLAVGTVDGQILQVASGAATGNAWSTAAYPSTAGSSGNVLVSNGANWSSSAITGITALGAQSQALDMNSHLINNVTDPVSIFDAANKNYVDKTALNGTSVYAASAATLGTVTQSGAGVGATLTNAGVQATFALDGATPPAGVNVLIKNTATGMAAANEGIYTVTSVGSGATNWVLTRATSYDTATEINNTGLILVQNGSTLAGTAWYNAATIVTVDTTAFNYNQFGNITFPITLANGGTSASLVASNGGIVYSNATTMAILAGIATANHMLLSGATAAPTWSTSTIPTSAGATANKVLLSDGTNYVLSTPTFPNASATLRKIIVSDGTNWIASTETYAVPGTSGNVLTSDGTNWISAVPASTALLTTKGDLFSFSTVDARLPVATGDGKVLQVSSGATTGLAYSTPTYPSASGTAGKILRSDGTNNVYTTSTFADTYTASNLLYSNGANTVTGLATVNSAGLLTNGSGVPAWVTATGTGAPVLGTGPTISAPLINQINDQTFNSNVITFTSSASAVNFITAVSSATLNAIGFQFQGSDTNVNAQFTNKGAGTFTFSNNLGGSVDNIFVLSGATTAVNYVTLASALTTASPTFTATGSDSNIALTLTGKGTGGVPIHGTGTNDSAAAGYVGELISSTVTTASATAYTSGNQTTVTSITLTAGDWNISGTCGLSGTTITLFEGAISTTTNSLPNSELRTIIFPITTGSATSAPVPSLPVSISANTTYYLVVFGTGTGSLSMFGNIFARRVR